VEKDITTNSPALTEENQNNKGMIKEKVEARGTNGKAGQEE